MSEKLKPCPFCGRPESEGKDGCICRSDTLTKMRRMDWNTRPIEDALKSELEAVKVAADSVGRLNKVLKSENERLRTALKDLAIRDNYEIINVHGVVKDKSILGIYYTKTGDQNSFVHPADVARKALEQKP